MKILLTLITILTTLSINAIAIPTLQGSNSDSKYYCPPCGCKSDHLKLIIPGECQSCGMGLISVKPGTIGETAIIISDAFRQTKTTNLYFDRFMYPVFFLGILISIFLLTKARKNRANAFLAALTLAISIYPFQNRIVCLSSDLTNDATTLMFLPISFILLIGPCTYFYIKSSQKSNFKLQPFDLIHFLPALVAFLVYSSLFFKNGMEKKEIYLSPEIVSLGNIEQTISVFLAFIYFYFSFRLTRHPYSQTELSQFNDNKIQTWPQKLVIILTALCTAWLIVLVINAILFDFAVSFLTYYPLWIAMMSFIIWIGYECFFQPQYAIINNNSGTTKAPDYSRNLSETEIRNYSFALRNLMHSDKPHLNPSLTLSKLADQLLIKPKDLTVVLNSGLNKNFYDFINEYRVQTAKEKLLDPQNDYLTILAIAYDSGFNSKSSFNAVFKKHVKMTPKEFKKRHPQNGHSKSTNGLFKR